MRRLSHTDWSSISHEERVGIDERMKAAVLDAARTALAGFVGTMATKREVAAVRARLAAIVEQSAEVSGDPLPPFWIEAHLDGSHLSTNISAPRHRHDCDDCTFLGRLEEFDLYSCPKGPLPTFIARFGDQGSQYKSGAAFVGIDPAITEAARRAERGR